MSDRCLPINGFINDNLPINTDTKRCPTGIESED